MRLDADGPDALFDGRENVVANIFETLDAINSGLYDERPSLRVARKLFSKRGRGIMNGWSVRGGPKRFRLAGRRF